MRSREGWPALFAKAFDQSRNAMVLVDDQRRYVEVNGAYLALMGQRRDAFIGRPIYDFVDGPPLMSRAEWAAALRGGDFKGEVQLSRADGGTVGVQWAASPEVVTGRRLVLVVALSTSRWGGRFRRVAPPEPSPGALSRREREIVTLVAAGRSGPEIADELQIAHDTVRTHVRNAMAKVGARSRAHLVARSLGDGLVPD